MADELVARAEEAISQRLELVRDGRGRRLRVVAGTYAFDIAVSRRRSSWINRESVDPPGAAPERGGRLCWR